MHADYLDLSLDKARFDEIQPRFGPLAGGTVVNLIGSWPGDESSYMVNLVKINESIPLSFR